MKYLMFSALSLILGSSRIVVVAAPARNKFFVHKYLEQNPSVSKKDLLNVAAVLEEVDELILRQLYDFGDVSQEFLGPENVNVSTAGIKKNISEINRVDSSRRYLFEGDILLSPSQANSILDNLLSQKSSDQDESRRKIRKRSAVLYDRATKWTSMPIKYTIDYSIGSAERRAIDEALEFWRTHTCIWFEYQPEIKGGDYISFFQGGDDSCYSHVGKIGGKQPISIGRNCARMGYVSHEIGHALGLWHEQARPDSDDHVRVLWQNVKSDMTSNFLKRTWDQTETYGIPYDMGSVMHYSAYAFTSDQKRMTIETLIPGYRLTIGQREAPSFFDVKAVNKLYCDGKCQNQYPCANGGYTHPGFCNTCLCPDGLGGTYCDGPENSKNAACGGLVYVANDWTNISSPNYPGLYDNNQRCSWLFRAPPGSRVVLEFIDIFKLSCGQTCTDYVEIKNDTDFANTGMR